MPTLKKYEKLAIAECNRTDEILLNIGLVNDKDYAYFSTTEHVKKGDLTHTIHITFKHNKEAINLLKSDGWKLENSYDSNGSLSFYSSDLHNDVGDLQELVNHSAEVFKMVRLAKIIHTEASNFGVPKDLN